MLEWLGVPKGLGRLPASRDSASLVDPGTPPPRLEVVVLPAPLSGCQQPLLKPSGSRTITRVY